MGTEYSQTHRVQWNTAFGITEKVLVGLVSRCEAGPDSRYCERTNAWKEQRDTGGGRCGGE